MANVLAIEPFYGGSHRSFLDGLVHRSRHRFHLLTMPPCSWKWRMRGSAITMWDRAEKSGFDADVILASDMLPLADFLALRRGPIPSILYMHENQLAYPVPENDQRDVHFGFTNILSCLAADRVVWNSGFHMESFFDALPGFIRMMPDHQPPRLSERIREKSLMIHPGVDLAGIDAVPIERDGGPPIIIWNHRWEFDKRPELFFAALDELAANGVDFRLAVLGENFQVKPSVFLEAAERFRDRIVHMGFVEDRRDYVKWLRCSSVSVSTAVQENFGIASVEAAYAGAAPVWPDGLSYPSLITTRHDHLYSDSRELVVKLKSAVMSTRDPATRAADADDLRRFDWLNTIGLYDELIESVL